jgi:DNA sulfur modification protein DndD
MMVERIDLTNFGPFHGHHELAFPGDGTGVHLIRGDNGQGKTSVQRAILWGLYGQVLDRRGQPIRISSFLNRTAYRDDTYEFGVTIHFNHNGKKWSLSRRTSARTHADRTYEAAMQLDVVCDGHVQPNPEQVLRRLIPQDVSRFFFFDGEMLRDYEELLDQSSTSMTLLRNSIEHVLGIPYLKTARDDAVQIQRRLESDRSRMIRRLGGEDYEQLVQDFQGIVDRIADRERQMKAIDEQIVQLESESQDRKRRLTEISAVRKLADDRARLDNQIAQEQSDWDKRAAQKRTLLTNLYKTVLVKGAADIIAHLEAKHEATMKKYDQKQQLIGRLADTNKAIAAQKCRLCGTVLDPAKLKGLSSEVKDLEKEIRDLTEVPEPNLEYDHLVSRLRSLQDQMITRDAFEGLDSGMDAIGQRLASLKAQLADVMDKLAGVDDEEPRRLALEIARSEKEQGRLTGVRSEQAKLNVDDLDLKSELDTKIAAIDRDELNVLGRRIEVVKPVIDILEEAISAYRDEQREKVGVIASDIFRELRTKSSFAKLIINEQFGLNIVTTDGLKLDRAEWRSAGEEEVVALSLVGALNRSAQIRAPVFMDTPFGRLDTKHGEKILTFLPKMSEQVVLLVTDREFRKQDEKFLAGHIKSDHTVIHKGETEGSEVIAT